MSLHFVILLKFLLLNQTIVLNLFLILFLIFSLISVGQTSVSGLVSDENGVPLPGANVVIDGTSTGVSTDFEFSDVKSVSSEVGGGELFLANTELSGEVRPFNLGDEFNIDSVSGSGLNQTGTMTCAGVADFRTLIKIGDIIEVYEVVEVKKTM